MTDYYADAIERFHRWLNDAKIAEMPEPTAMNLATANAQGQPSSRTVLLKHADQQGFVFYTNTGSRKGQQIAANAHAALCFVWLPLHRQVRVEGQLQAVRQAEADAYFATRVRGSQIGAWASKQSSTLPDRQTLEQRIEHFEREFEGADVPRPEWWSGYRLVPTLIEFWAGRKHRLHERQEYTRVDGSWQLRLLYP
ncbi:MAG: pyridoxine/pyridoxamine 5'-phosphate oxidase [Lysobacteraceae bacterium]|nr:MAG: pyridoxine/pyridoxamine 5'-phosphate oxidase [Xanthomonadaceae bacterium]